MAVKFEDDGRYDGRLEYRPTYFADRVLVAIIVGGVGLSALFAWWFVGR